MRFFVLIALMAAVLGGIAAPAAAQPDPINETVQATGNTTLAAVTMTGTTSTPTPTPTPATPQSSTRTETEIGTTSTPTRTASTSTPTATITPDPTPQPTARPAGRTNQSGPQNLTQVSENVRLVDSGYNSAEGTAWVKLRAVDHSETATISDGGAISEGSGEIDTERVALHPGETIRVSVPVTRVDGMVAVIIATEGGGLYGELIQPPSNLPWEETSPTTGWLGGATSVMCMASLAAYRYVNREPDQPEQIG